MRPWVRAVVRRRAWVVGVCLCWAAFAATWWAAPRLAKGSSAVVASRGWLAVGRASVPLRVQVKPEFEWPLWDLSPNGMALLQPPAQWRPGESAATISVSVGGAPAPAPISSLDVFWFPLWWACAAVSLLVAMLVARTAYQSQPGHCPSCGYDRRGLAEGPCPECGLAARA